jgi:hypothetical protein
MASVTVHGLPGVIAEGVTATRARTGGRSRAPEVPICINRLVAQRDVLLRCSVRGHVGVKAGDLGWSKGIGAHGSMRVGV